jgi:hypothetical protein
MPIDGCVAYGMAQRLTQQGSAARREELRWGTGTVPDGRRTAYVCASFPTTGRS